MPDRPDVSPATAHVIVPRVSLASCVRAHLVRSTMHVPPLPPEQRFNHFPASPLCSLSWFVHGGTRIVEPAGAATEGLLPQVLFGGPQDRPFSSWNPGPVHVFMVMFFPQAFHALTGLDLSCHVNAIVPIDAVLPAPWQAMAQEVLAAPDDPARIACVERFLEPRWQAARASGNAAGGVLGDWVQALSLHAASTNWGRSARHLERRIKAWAGQPLRKLRRMSRAEQSFLQMRRELEAARHMSWAEAAARGGFADQAHFCRETRALTGLSPTELARKARDDESYWVYRVWS